MAPDMQEKCDYLQRQLETTEKALDAECARHRETQTALNVQRQIAIDAEVDRDDYHAMLAGCVEVLQLTQRESLRIKFDRYRQEFIAPLCERSREWVTEAAGKDVAAPRLQQIETLINSLSKANKLTNEANERGDGLQKQITDLRIEIGVWKDTVQSANEKLTLVRKQRDERTGTIAD